MMVYIYCILIAAILFTIFKITNKLTGFKIALLQFTLALEKSIIKDIVLFCGGNPDLVDPRLWFYMPFGQLSTVVVRIPEELI